MKNQGKLVLFSFVIGILYAFLFFQKQAGISHIIFVLVLLGSLAYWLKQYGLIQKNAPWLLAVPTVLLSLRFFISNNWILAFFNQIGIVILFITMCILLTVSKSLDWGRISFITNILATIFMPFRYFLKLYQWLWQKTNIKKDAPWLAKGIKIVVGICISLPLLFIVLALLSSADMVFANLLMEIPNKIFSLLDGEGISTGIGFVCIVILVTTYSFGYVWNLFEPNDKDTETIQEQLPIPRPDATIMITILLLFNIVYVLFSYIQFSYLFSANANVLPGGSTYANYARQGFFELLFVTFINFGIILLALFFLKERSKKVTITIKTLLFIMGTTTYIMIYSSFYRMGLYQQNYGYTYLRMGVYFFLFLETFLLGGTLLYILRPRFHLGKMYILLTLSFYIGFNYMNVDHFIAKRNIDFYLQTGTIDTYYLRSLSYDAIPQLTRLLDSSDPTVVKDIKEYLIAVKEDLDMEIKWQSFTYSTYRAKKSLEFIE